MRTETRNDSAVFRELCSTLLEQGMSVQFEARGVSMSPTIRSGDMVQVEPLEPHELHRGDIVLGQDTGRFILHRVMGRDERMCSTRGDSSREADRSIAVSEVVGRVLSARRKMSGRTVALAPASLKRLHMARASVYRSLRKLRGRLFPVLNASALLMALVLGLATLASAAVAVDSTSSSGLEIPVTTDSLGQHATTGATSTLTFNHTTNSSLNAALIVGVSINLTSNTAVTVSNVTYNGVGLTKLGAVVNGTTVRVEMWGLLGPATGTNSVVVTLTGTNATAVGVVAGATTLTGVSSFGAFSSNASVANSNNPNITVASAATQLVFDVMATTGNRTVTAFSAPETARWSLNSTAAVTGTDVTGAASTFIGGAAASASQTLSGKAAWVIGAVIINPAAGNGNGTLTFAHTTAGTNRLMMVGVSLNLTNNAAATVSSVTYNGVALTLVGSHNDAGNTRRMELWKLVAPPVGTFNVVVTIGGLTLTQSNMGVVAGATTFTGVDQNTPLGTFASNDGAATTNSTVTVTSNPGEVVIDTLATGGDVTVTGFTGSQTSQWNLNSGGTTAALDVTGFGSTAVGAPNVTTAEVLSAASNWSLGAVSIKPVTASITVTKSVSPNPPTPGNNATYTIQITNAGPSPATGVTLTDVLPGGVTFVSSTPGSPTCNNAAGTVTCNLPDIASGANSIVTITVSIPAAFLGALNNSASVTENEFDPSTFDNVGVVSTSIQSSTCATPTAGGAGGTLTGTVNTYFPGTANAAAGALSITVGPGTGPAAIASGDILMVMQMQDAAINSTNTDSYGDGISGPPATGQTALNSVGNYEYVTATSGVTVAGGGTINLTGSGSGGGLLYSYTNAAATATMGQRKFQVIRVPQYSTATLGSGLTAAHWNGSIGGVLAIDVAQTLTLGGIVDLSGFGFRGAGGRLLAGPACTGSGSEYVSMSTSLCDGGKGEGIAGTPRFVYNQAAGTLVDNGAANEGYPNGSYARGAPGNAGGGGTDPDQNANTENSGGGGGGNGGAGGMGGDAWQATLPLGGYGGAAFPGSVLRLTMGGGGGAGDTNNGTSDPNTNTTGINSSGAAGGGIIMIRAGAVNGTGTLQANGATALNVMNDGGGGGGAGGAIVVLASSGGLTGLTANVQGGKGGDTWRTQAPGTPYSGARHGPGGGGGGGVVLISSSPLAASNVAGGANGLTVTTGDPFGSSAGSAGAVVNVGSQGSAGTGSGAACTTDLAITKTSAPSPVITGNTLTYTITVTNNGFSTATAANVSDTLPGTVTFSSVSSSQGTCSQASGVVSCSLGSIASGASATITINVTAGAPNLVSNTATVADPNQTDTSAGDNSATDNNVIVFPNAVGLQSFTATREGNRVLLRWTTGDETNNLGFNVYREISGRRMRLNPSLIAGSSLLMRDALPRHSGRTYSWIDSSGAAGDYWLEDVDVRGNRVWHGPAAISLGTIGSSSTPRSPFLAELNRITSPDGSAVSRSHPLGSVAVPVAPSLTRQQTQIRLAASHAMKILVQQEGVYKVTLAQLLAAGFPAAVSASNLHLYAEGVEQPIRNDSNAIEFYGTAIDTPYSGTRVYWLVSQAGQATGIPALNSAISSQTPRSFPQTVELKDRTTYFAALLNGEADNFFGAVINSTATNQVLTVTGLDSTSDQDAVLKIALQGVTRDVPHRVTVALNGTAVGEVDFTQQTEGISTFSLPASSVQPGANTVTLTGVGGEDDVSLVDYIQLTYARTYAAASDALKFSANSGDTVSLTGFTNSRIRVLDVTVPGRPVEIVPQVQTQNGESTAVVGIPGSLSGNRILLAVASDAFAVPAGLVNHVPSSLHSIRSGAQFLDVTHPDFAGALLPLEAVHTAQGMSVLQVDVDQIYDEFNFGEKSPFAIRDFLQLAQQQWRVPPQFLLLAGRASFDPRDYLGFGDLDFVPTKIVDTSEMETASDDWFTDFNSTGQAQIPTGRLPVGTPAQATALVSKIVGYEKNSAAGPWKSQAVLVADVNIGFDFTGLTASVQSQLPASLTATPILLSQTGLPTGHAQLLSALNSGTLFVNYAGHGSTEIWSGNEFFTSDDALALTNGPRLPFIVAIDCLNGFFQDVYTHSLAASFLLAENGGAVGVWASSGLTQPAPQAQMDQALIPLIFGNLTVGQAVLQAKQGINDSDVRRTWILFGDPAMHLAAPPLPGGAGLRSPTTVSPARVASPR